MADIWPIPVGMPSFCIRAGHDRGELKRVGRVGGPVLPALEVLGGFGLFRELEQVPDLFEQHGADLGGRGEEELAALVDDVDAPVGERPVQVGFHADGVK